MKKNSFMEIKNASDNSADLYIYGDIVTEKWYDTDVAPDEIRELLKQVDNVDNLNIYISSGGGSVFSGLAIFNMLKRHKAYKTVYVDGIAASISSVIMFAGDKIVVPSNSFVMVHKPLVGIYGNSNDLQKMIDDLNAIEEGIMNVYAENLKEGVDIETVRQMVQEETWLNGKECSEIFNIEVGEENKVAACTSDYYKEYKQLPNELVVEEVHNNKVNQEEKLIWQNEMDLLEL